MVVSPSTDVTDLTFQAALDKLVSVSDPREDRTTPPPGWRKWKRPSPTLAVDSEIERLIRKKSNKSAKITLRDQADLERECPDFCPFYFMRLEIAAAVGTAHVTVGRAVRAEATLKSLKALRADAKKIASSLIAFRNTYNALLFANDFTLDGSSLDMTAYHARLEKVMLLFEVLKGSPLTDLQALELLAADEIKKLSPNRGDIWKQIFVEQLGHSWHFLTGSVPSAGTGGPFLAFVEACCASLHEEDISFERPVKTVLARVAERPEWDRFDRDSRRTDKLVYFRDGVRFVENPSEADLLSELRLIIAKARRGTPGAVSALQAILSANPEKYEPLVRPWAEELSGYSTWTYEWTDARS